MIKDMVGRAPNPDFERADIKPLDCLTAIVIPARMESTRLPGKALLEDTGKPLIYYTIDNALESLRATDVGFVTDSHELFQRVGKDYRGKMLALASKRAASHGSQRVGYWLQHFDAWDTYGCVVNLQCDEPCIDARDLDNLIAACALSEDICTLVAELPALDWNDSSAVKAWLRGNLIIDFTRHIPCGSAIGPKRLHLGAYAIPRRYFRAVFKDRLSPRAQSMSLEQLTWLDGGLKIRAVEVKYSAPISVNTPESYRRFVAWCKRREGA